MLKKLSGKLTAKFPATTPGCSMIKIARLNDTFQEVFLTARKPSRKSITAAQTKEKAKNKSKLKSLKPYVTFSSKVSKFWFLHMPEPKCRTNAILVTRASCCVANAFSTRLKLIWPRSSLKTTKMSKNAFLAKSSRSKSVKDRQICPGLNANQIQIPYDKHHKVSSLV